MLKLYYTDHLKAAWMAREFGVFILTGSQHCQHFEHTPRTDGSCGYDRKCVNWVDEHTKDEILILDDLSDKDKLYIHPDSYHIFEPQVGDVYIATYKADAGNGDFIEEEIIEKLPFEKRLKWSYDIKILQRDNKAFFEPETEDE